MICKFSYKGAPVYVRAESIVAIMPDISNVNHTAVFAEAPLNNIIIDETIDDAFCEWYNNLNAVEDGDAEEMHIFSWEDVAIEV
mgnify:CR=1 FL=1|tara:strand:+ start:646 stop:897 length:252 start_codon:yes stop_codon:yes gene_type:complete